MLRDAVHHVQWLGVALEGPGATNAHRHPPLARRRTSTPGNRASSMSATLVGEFRCATSPLTEDTAPRTCAARGSRNPPPPNRPGAVDSQPRPADSFWQAPSANAAMDAQRTHDAASARTHLRQSLTRGEDEPSPAPATPRRMNLQGQDRNGLSGDWGLGPTGGPRTGCHAGGGPYIGRAS